jgi:hypothetical protein
MANKKAANTEERRTMNHDLSGRLLQTGTKQVSETSVKGAILLAIDRVKQPTYEVVLKEFTKVTKLDEREFRKHLFPCLYQDIVRLAPTGHKRAA